MPSHRPEQRPSEGVAATPQPPYYAVIFTSDLADDTDGYEEMAERMLELASRQPGFLGFESAREEGVGVTVSYWSSENDVVQWKRHVEHRLAQKMGRDRWYRRYKVRVAKVERDYGHVMQDT